MLSYVCPLARIQAKIFSFLSCAVKLCCVSMRIPSFGATMTFNMPPVCNQYVIKEIDVILNIMANRTLTKTEILTAVARYKKTANKWPPDNGSRVTIPFFLSQR